MTIACEHSHNHLERIILNGWVFIRRYYLLLFFWCAVIFSVSCSSSDDERNVVVFKLRKPYGYKIDSVELTINQSWKINTRAQNVTNDSFELKFGIARNQRPVRGVLSRVYTVYWREDITLVDFSYIQGRNDTAVYRLNPPVYSIYTEKVQGFVLDGPNFEVKMDQLQ